MLKVIIAEDERRVLQLIRKLVQWKELDLENVGEADNGLAALDLILSQAPDVVITDIRMPGMDGLEALPRILGLKEGLPVILNTAYTQYQESFMSWAADAYVVKSSDLSELKAKVKELIKE